MAKAKSNLPFVTSHWYHFFEDLNHSTQDLYRDIELAIAERNLPDIHVRRIELSVGGVFSAKRVYLRVSRKGLIFDICGAPYGNGFFVSWWLSEPLRGCLAIVALLPFVNLVAALFIPPDTYFKRDTTLMFQQSIHQAVQEVVSRCLETRGLRALTEDERKPILRELRR